MGRLSENTADAGPAGKDGRMTTTQAGVATLPADFDRPWMLGTLARGLAFVLADLVVLLVAQLRAAGTAAPDADIGTGLLLFAFGLGGAAVWGAVDGHRFDRLAPVLVRWALVAAVAGCFPPLYRAVSGGPDLAVLGSDLVEVGGFTAALILCAATLGCLIGVLIERQSPLR